MSRSCLIVDIHPKIKERFKLVCDREGDTMSRKIRRWIILYLDEHEKGNPQTLLNPVREKSLLELMLDEKPPKNFPMNIIRREKIVELAKFLNKHQDMPRSEAVGLFALQNGFRVETVRKYVRMLDRHAKRRES